jgi:hypothetical protein
VSMPPASYRTGWGRRLSRVTTGWDREPAELGAGPMRPKS